MQAEVSKTMYKQMWFGINAMVTMGFGFVHKAGIGIITVPHPPVVNWILRQKLAVNANETLSFAHEFGHLQTFPLAVCYTAAMFLFAAMKRPPNVIEIFLILISIQAAWEMTAELLTIAGDIHYYRKSYEDMTVIPRLVFWFVSGILTITGWMVILL